VKPYWQSDDGAIVVFNARWEDVLAAGAIQVREVALVHADPPYGQNERTERGKAGRGRNQTAATKLHGGRFLSASKALARAQDFPAIVGDDKPFDPAPLLALQRPLVTWGAQRYTDRLPTSPSWLWWDKREEVLPDDNGDGEMAWTNLGGPPRQFSLLWRGTCRASETGAVHLHPTQKPIALSSWVFARAKLKPGNLVFVPYMGSGPDLPAALAMGLRVAACEVVEEYCRVAVARLGAVTAEAARAPVGPLFAGGGR
jgi:site-specific DNA-methyltransferase (adenine-specific)/modification methylase